MEHEREEMTETVAEVLCWEVARWGDSRSARRPVPQAGRRRRLPLDAGALRADFFDFLRAIDVMALWEQGYGVVIHREMVPGVQDCPALGGEDPVWDEAQQCPVPFAVQR